LGCPVAQSTMSTCQHKVWILVHSCRRTPSCTSEFSGIF
jgi:hypothetical protein